MSEKQRLVFVDLLRGWALIVMIEVHVLNSLMMTQLKLSAWYPYVNFINGLVAPSFLFVSGFAFILASRKKIEEFKEYKYIFWRQIGRILLIFIVGYSLHLPYLNVHKMMAIYNTPGWADFLKVDVLQCIAIGLAILFASRMFIKSEQNHLAFIIMTGAVFVLAAPLMWLIDFSKYMPLVIADFFNPSWGSLFPLFPWIGFLTCGAVAAYYFLWAKEKGGTDKYKKHILTAGLAFVVIGHLTLTEGLPFFIRMPRPNWMFFILRLGYVLILLWLSMYYEKKKGMKKSFILDVSRESLLVYWLHLQVLYRKVWNDTSIETVVNYRFGIWECIAATLILITVMIYAAKLWGGLKKKSPMVSQALFWFVLAVCTMIFYMA